jgi:hypothetical protein
MTSILILSEQCDTITDEICLWLNYFGKKYLRINEEDSRNCSYRIETVNSALYPILVVDEIEYPLSDFSTVWFRRGILSYNDYKVKIDCFEADQDNQQLEKILLDYKYSEFDRIKEYFYQYLHDNARCFNFPTKYNINKLLALEYAKSVGLNIPDTLCTHCASTKTTSETSTA